jgi:hypothetical protein
MRSSRLAAFVLVFSLSAPAFAARRSDGPTLFDRLDRVFQRIVHSIVTNGNGLIPPIP